MFAHRDSHNLFLHAQLGSAFAKECASSLGKSPVGPVGFWGSSEKDHPLMIWRKPKPLQTTLKLRLELVEKGQGGFIQTLASPRKASRYFQIENRHISRQEELVTGHNLHFMKHTGVSLQDIGDTW